MSDRLKSILRVVETRLRERREAVPLREMAARIDEQPAARSLREALRRPGKGTTGAARLRILGELKRKSPSAGAINEALDPPQAARDLAAAGCVALSVLTEEDHFGGSLSSLASVRAVVDLPLLRKDFIVDIYQIVEARAHGADAVLLLAAVLDDHRLLAFRDRADELGMDVLVEAHGESELDRILALDLPLVGVNARDLTSFEVDLPRALKWCTRVPADRVLVAESGLRTREDAQRVERSCADAALVGEGLMRGDQPARRYAELFGQEEP